MSTKKKIAVGIGIFLVALLVVIVVIACVEGSKPVWAKVELEVEWNLYHTLCSNYCDGKLYYAEYDDEQQITELDVLSGEKKVLPLKWPENFLLGTERLWGFWQVTVGADGCIYGVIRERTMKVFLCKFMPTGELVYFTDVTKQIQTTKTRSWHSGWSLEVDGKGRAYLSHPYELFLYDENGIYEKCIDVNPEEAIGAPQIIDMFPGRDGNMQLYIVEDSYRQVQVDYETGELEYIQDLMPGDLFGYDVPDGFYVSTSETLYRYSMDQPMLGRVPEKVLDWWDLLIYKDTVKMVEGPQEDCILAVVGSTLEDRSGAFLIRKMSKWEAERGGYTYAEIR